MSMARFLQDKRINRNMTVEEVSEKSKLSVGGIRAYEQGRRIPSVVSWRKLLPIFDVAESTWIDSVTWQDPTDGAAYELAPKPGAWAGSRKTNCYDKGVRSQQISMAVLRINVIEAVLKTDRKTLKAITILLTK